MLEQWYGRILHHRIHNESVEWVYQRGAKRHPCHPASERCDRAGHEWKLLLPAPVLIVLHRHQRRWHVTDNHYLLNSAASCWPSSAASSTGPLDSARRTGPFAKERTR